MNTIMHGGRLDEAIEQYGGDREDWLDLSTGINPRTYPIGEISDHVWQRLPGWNAEKNLLDSARQYYQVKKDIGIVAANGTQALIQVLPEILNVEKVAIVSPTYGEHQNCWAMRGASIACPDDFGTAIETADIVVVGNPNNPDGKTYLPEQLAEGAGNLAQRGGCLIIDEAFCDVRPNLSLVPALPENAIVLRSFGKFFGLAGLRLGFALCHPGLALKFSQRTGPWSVSGPALAIGAKALSDKTWQHDAIKWIFQQSEKQGEILSELSLAVTGNAGLFMDVHCAGVETVHQKLLAEKILIRDFAERPGFLRFGLCADDGELERLSATLRRIIS